MLAPGAETLIRRSLPFLAAFATVAVGIGFGRALTTTFLPVLLERIENAPVLIGVVMLVNAAAGLLVPLAVGLWSDRRRDGRLGRRVPFLVGGALLTSLGLLAVALGTGTSYAVLAAAGALVYVGLNTTATAHRAMVPESFEDAERPAATSAQEVAMLVGSMAGVVAGGVLIADTPDWLVFAAAAGVLPLLVVPTLIACLRHLRGAPTAETAAPAAGERSASVRDFVAAMRRPGAREVLFAQILWVLGYAALPAFFVLYAGDVLGLGVGAAALLPAAFGVLTGVGMLAAARTRPELVRPRLILGAALLGGGLLLASPFDTVALASVPFAFAALGMGLVTALGFPYFARFIPEGQSGRYSGLYFSVRAIATAVALPVAGGLIQATGSYRVLLLQGGAGLLALIPLRRAEREAPVHGRRPLYDRPRRVAAVIPCYSSRRFEAVVSETLRHVDEVVLVDDGAPPDVSAALRAIDSPQVRLVRLEKNSGKGDSLAAGAALLLAEEQPPDAVVTVDSDGQHPPSRIPSFVEAARFADVVIGDRSGDRSGMPLVRRFTNSFSTGLLRVATRRLLRDSQCGMRLYRTEALRRVPLPPGRYEAETRHLKQALRAGLELAWVPIPAIYDGAVSSFRPVRDSTRVLVAALTPSSGRAKAAWLGPSRSPGAAFLRGWAGRFATLIAATLALGAMLGLLQPLDERFFVAVNSLGDGPEWLYQLLDPHTRNYVVVSLVAVLAASFVGPRRALAAALAVTVAAFLSDILVQGVYLVFDRPRPEEALAAQVQLSHGRSWAHIASFPSGHMVVTTAIAVAAIAVVPALRGPVWIYVAAVAVTRIVFGAHFPLDVAAGVVFGYEVGRFSAAAAHAVGVLERTPASALPLPYPIPALRPAGARGQAPPA